MGIISVVFFSYKRIENDLVLDQAMQKNHLNVKKNLLNGKGKFTDFLNFVKSLGLFSHFLKSIRKITILPL